ncbi:MAG: AIR synthase-related protein, partial [Pseudomonadota bacterium]|nr:AIR synthase-related protein [Pseudomonadota bacterium]
DLDEILWCDPQTSGGLMVSCSEDAVDDVLACFHAAGHSAATVIGRMQAGEAGVRVE